MRKCVERVLITILRSDDLLVDNIQKKNSKRNKSLK